jgi:hypothetical protein
VLSKQLPVEADSMDKLPSILAACEKAESRSRGSENVAPDCLLLCLSTVMLTEAGSIVSTNFVGLIEERRDPLNHGTARQYDYVVAALSCARGQCVHLKRPSVVVWPSYLSCRCLAWCGTIGMLLLFVYCIFRAEVGGETGPAEG